MENLSTRLSPPSRVKRYLAGLSTDYVRVFTSAMVGLWLTPFILRRLDTEQYAIFSLTLQVLMWVGLLDFGITAGLRLQAARMSGEPDGEKLNRLASTAFFTQNVLVLTILLLSVGLGLVFPRFFPVRPELQHEATMVFLLTASGAALSICTQTFSALLIAHQQVHVDNMISMLLIVIRTVLTVLLLESGWGLYSLAAAHFAAKVITGTLAVIRTHRLLPNLRIRYRLASWEVLRGTARLGIWFTFGSLAGLVIECLGSLVTAKVISVATVTSLTLTNRLYDLVGGLIWSVTETARPMLGQILGANKMEHALKTYRQLFALSTGLAIIVALAVWSGNSCFLSQWVGAANYGGKLVDLALGLNLIVHMWIMPNRAILSANLSVRAPVLSRLAEGALNLSLSIILGRFLGLLGVLMGTCIAASLTSLWILPLLTARMFKRSFASFVWEDAARAVMLFALLFPISILSRSIATSLDGYLGATVGASLTGLCGLGLFWFMVLDQPLRSRISSVALQFGRKSWAGA